MRGGERDSISKEDEEITAERCEHEERELLHSAEEKSGLQLAAWQNDGDRGAVSAQHGGGVFPDAVRPEAGQTKPLFYKL